MNTKSTTPSRKPKAPSHEWKQRFLDALADTGRLNDACQKAGVVRQTIHYALRSDPEFAEEYRFAKEWFFDAIEAEAIRRALEGIQKPVFYRGEKIAEVTVYSDRLLEFLLKRRRPEPIPAVEQAPPEDPQYDAQGRIILTPAYMAKLQVAAAKLMEERSQPGYVSPYGTRRPESNSETTPPRDIPSGKETPLHTQTRNGAVHSPPQSSSQPTVTASAPTSDTPPPSAPNPGSSTQTSPPKPEPAESAPPQEPRNQSPANPPSHPAQPPGPPIPPSPFRSNLAEPPRRPPRSGINRG